MSDTPRTDELAREVDENACLESGKFADLARHLERRMAELHGQMGELADELRCWEIATGRATHVQAGERIDQLETMLRLERGETDRHRTRMARVVELEREVAELREACQAALDEFAIGNFNAARRQRAVEFIRRVMGSECHAQGGSEP